MSLNCCSGSVMKVKVCGITRLEDAKLCLQCGANMLGFIFYAKSPRYIDPRDAADIIQTLKQEFEFKSTGVFVDVGHDEISRIAGISALDMLQFHGNEPPEFVNTFRQEKIKAFRIKDAADISQCEKYSDAYYLFDAFSHDAYGGTGKSFDWDYLIDFKYKERLFLSGGINTGNLDKTLKINSYAIDVCSGLEKSPGIKDENKVKDFFLKLKV